MIEFIDPVDFPTIGLIVIS